MADEQVKILGGTMNDYAEAVLLRTRIRALGLNTEVVTAIQEVLGTHGIVVSAHLASQLTLAAAPEIDVGRAHVIQ